MRFLVKIGQHKTVEADYNSAFGALLEELFTASLRNKK
jgi:hypothetical protein